jgi:hexosaminidase
MVVQLIPQPKSVTEHAGPPFQLDARAVIVARGEAVDAAWLLHGYLHAGTGLRLAVVPDTPAGRTVISLDLAGERPEPGTVAAESYRLSTDVYGIRVVAGHPAGLLNGVQTLRQLLPADTLRAAPIDAGPVTVPSVSVDDEPRFAWRGLMLDVARHFMPKPFLLRMIDLAALHRLNVIHLHLTDDQGWRLEVPGWPRLTEIGSWRDETITGHARDTKGYDGTPHGGYYTAADLREMVAYAAARNITIVPEIDLPGHVRSVLAGYPELGNTGESQPVATTFGVFPEVLAPTDAALRFAADVFDTVCDIFPSEHIHIGGDEVPRTEWRDSAAARARAAELGLDSVDHIQSWFTREFAEHLGAKGRKIIGWDEVLDGGAPPDAVIAVWRDFSIAAKAIEKGHRVIVMPHDAVYLNYYPSTSPDEPLHIFMNTPLEKVAAFEPVPDTADDAAVLGVQAALWSEYLPEPSDVEYAAFPRLAAVADLAWSLRAQREEYPVADRVATHLARLDALSVNYRPLGGPHPWQRGGTGARARFDFRPSAADETRDLPGR